MNVITLKLLQAPTSYPFVGVPQSWNETPFPTIDSEFLPNLETNDLCFPSYSDFLRAKVFKSCTNDWNQNYQDQYAQDSGDQNSLPFPENTTIIPFADMAAPDQMSTDRNPEFSASYGATLDNYPGVEAM